MPRFLIPNDNPYIKQHLCTNAHDPHTVALMTDEDPTGALEEARFWRDHAAAGGSLRDVKRRGRMRAVVPMSVWAQAQREQWDQAQWRRWLNDPANSGLRVDRREGLGYVAR